MVALERRSFDGIDRVGLHRVSQMGARPIIRLDRRGFHIGVNPISRSLSSIEPIAPDSQWLVVEEWM